MIYTAITIGPIYNTLTSVKSTKAIWAASYLFSWLMRKLIEDIPKEDLVDVLMPYLPAQNDSSVKAGLLPDRCILKRNYGHEFQTKKKQLIQNLAKRTLDDVKNQRQYLDMSANNTELDLTTKEVEDFLTDYLRVDIVEMELESSVNPIFEINKILDSQELLQLPLEELKVDYLNLFFETVYYNFLVREKYFGAQKYFPSTAEISTYGFKEEPSYYKAQKILRKSEGPGQSVEAAAKSQQDFYKNVKSEFSPLFRNHHKYMAIVQADGDNMGKVISAIYDSEDKEEAEKNFKLFSEQLFKFTSGSVQLIQSWAAVPVYGGGDDLLFFSPIAKPTDLPASASKAGVIEETIFDLIDKLDQLFDDLILKYECLQSIIDKLKDNEEPVLPTLSFGVSIGYYKFPLNQSLIKSAGLLFGQAKQQPGKNSVAFEIIKHSGQHFGATFNKSSGAYQAFKEMIRPSQNKEFIPDESFLRSIAHKLELLSASILAIAEQNNPGNGATERNRMFQNLFENHFDEAIHREGKDLNPFLVSVLSLLQKIYTDSPVSVASGQKAKAKIHESNIQKLYASLRFVSFIHNKEDRDEF